LTRNFWNIISFLVQQMALTCIKLGRIVAHGAEG
jgi:hypothetical protein